MKSDWPTRPERAGDNPVCWTDMSVIWQGDDEPSGDVRDRDRWAATHGEYVRRDGRWERMA